MEDVPLRKLKLKGADRSDPATCKRAGEVAMPDRPIANEGRTEHTTDDEDDIARMHSISTERKKEAKLSLPKPRKN